MPAGLRALIAGTRHHRFDPARGQSFVPVSYIEAHPPTRLFDLWL
jgi:hypothetical protein